MLPLWFKIFIPLSILIWAYYLWYVFFRFNPYYANGMSVLGVYALLALFPVVLLVTSLLIYRGQSLWLAVFPFLFVLIAFYSFYQTNFASAVDKQLSENSTKSEQETWRVKYQQVENLPKFSLSEGEDSKLFITTAANQVTLYSAERNADGVTWHYRAPVIFGQIEPGNVIRMIPNSLGNMATKDLSGFVDAEGRSLVSVYKIVE